MAPPADTADVSETKDSTRPQTPRHDCPRPSAKTDQIVDAAERLFLDAGYGAVSMDAIAAEAQVSKRTVYSHFQNKEALFIAVMDRTCDRIGGNPIFGNVMQPGKGIPVPESFGDAPPGCPMSAIIPDDPPETVLTALGRRFLSILWSDNGIRLFRIVLAESGRFPELGRLFYESGPKPVVERLSLYLSRQHERGAVTIDDPTDAAWRFLGMVKDPTHMLLCLGVVDLPDMDAREESVTKAVQRFMEIYGPTQRG